MANKDKTPALYPHVGSITDHPTASSLRLVWDQLRNQNKNNQNLDEQIRALQQRILTLDATANRALTLAQGAATGATAPTPTPAAQTPSDGPPIPNPPPPSPPVPPQPPTSGTMSSTDDISLASVTFLNSPNVSGWAQTATMTTFDFNVNGAAPDFDLRVPGAGQWPTNFIPPGFDGPIQYTLWIFLNIGGSWYGSGCIEYWYSPPPNPPVRNGGPPSGVAANWYYDPGRWAPMTGHQPAVGENVGFMVAAGDERNSRGWPITERSQVVVIPFPSDAGCIFMT